MIEPPWGQLEVQGVSAGEEDGRKRLDVLRGQAARAEAVGAISRTPRRRSTPCSALPAHLRSCLARNARLRVPSGARYSQSGTAVSLCPLPFSPLPQTHRRPPLLALAVLGFPRRQLATETHAHRSDRRGRRNTRSGRKRRRWPAEQPERAEGGAEHGGVGSRLCLKVQSEVRNQRWRCHPRGFGKSRRGRTGSRWPRLPQAPPGSTRRHRGAASYTS